MRLTLMQKIALAVVVWLQPIITFEMAAAPAGAPASIVSITMKDEPGAFTSVSVRNTSLRPIRRVTVQARVAPTAGPPAKPSVFTSTPLATSIAPGNTVALASGLLDMKSAAALAANGPVTATFSILRVEFDDGGVWSAPAQTVEPVVPHLSAPVGPEPYNATALGIVPPRVIRQIDPKYTPAAMRAKIQGLVEMRVVVGRDGTVMDVRVTQSLDPEHGLDLEAIRTVSQWKFTPGTLNGKPVATSVTIKMEFRLH